MATMARAVLHRVEIRLLGELTVLRDGAPQPLPRSRKARALLGYLVATGRVHHREHLCDLLWDGPADPRAELRWCLSRIRPALDEECGLRLVADREHVGFTPGGAAVDLRRASALVGAGAERASTEELLRAAAEFRGELLEGLELHECFCFHQWCLGERDAARAMRVAILGALIERLRDRPEDALRHARELVAVAPLSEAANATLVSILDALGRRREARAQHDSSRRLLERELGLPA
jgi:DNA-binding SARP family transcriptional activator